MQECMGRNTLLACRRASARLEITWSRSPRRVGHGGEARYSVKVERQQVPCSTPGPRCGKQSPLAAQTDPGGDPSRVHGPRGIWLQRPRPAVAYCDEIGPGWAYRDVFWMRLSPLYEAIHRFQTVSALSMQTATVPAVANPNRFYLHPVKKTRSKNVVDPPKTMPRANAICCKLRENLICLEKKCRIGRFGEKNCVWLLGFPNHPLLRVSKYAS